jgi:hypothetical protein
VDVRAAHLLPSTETVEEQKERDTKKYKHTKNMQASIASFNWSP